MTSKTNIFSILFLFSFWSIFAQNKEIDSLKQILETSKNDIEKSQVLNQISDLYKTQDLIMIAEFAKQTLVLSQKIEKGLARAYRSIGIVFSEQSNYSKALKYHLKAKELQEK